MKYTKPKDATGRYALSAFVDSLPDEFEIVQPGMRQVKWPECASKRELDLLYQTYKNPYPIKFDRPIPYDEQLATVLHALAAIAPVEKKRKWNLWIIGGDPRPYAHPPEWTPSDSIGTGWRKVGGPFEVDA